MTEFGDIPGNMFPRNQFPGKTGVSSGSHHLSNRSLNIYLSNYPSMDSLNEISYLVNEESTIIEEEVNVLAAIKETSDEQDDVSAQVSIQRKYMLGNKIIFLEDCRRAVNDAS